MGCVRTALIASVGLALCLQSPAAPKPRQGHSQYLAELTARSMKQGMSRADVALLQVVPAPGRDAVAGALADEVARGQLGPRLQLSGLKPSRTGGDSITLIGPSGYVDVFADGSRFRVRGNIDDPDAIEKAGPVRLEKVELEALGHRAVGTQIAKWVRLGEREQLTFLGVRYLHVSDGTFDPADAKENDRVIANIAIYGREVDGLPIVGSGSKVAVWFANDRALLGFDVDWPTYKITEHRQRVLPADELRRRVAATTVPLEGTNGVEVSRFECGYVDLGATRREGMVQSGCSISYDGRSQDGERWARIEFVPAGADVLKEKRWPLASMIAGGRVVNTSSPEFQRYLSEPEPPGQAPAPARPPRPPGNRGGQ